MINFYESTQVISINLIASSKFYLKNHSKYFYKDYCWRYLALIKKGGVIDKIILGSYR